MLAGVNTGLQREGGCDAANFALEEGCSFTVVFFSLFVSLQGYQEKNKFIAAQGKISLLL